MSPINLDQFKNSMLGVLVIQSAMLKLAGVGYLHQVTVSLLVIIQICVSIYLLLIAITTFKNSESDHIPLIDIIRATALVSLAHFALFLYIFTNEPWLKLFILTLSVPVIATPGLLWLLKVKT